MTPHERLMQHEQLVTLVLEHGFMPQKSAQNFRDMIAAMREIDPNGNYDGGCAGCLMDLMNRARFFINQYKQENKDATEAIEALKFMTFPKQEPKKRGPKPKQ